MSKDKKIKFLREIEKNGLTASDITAEYSFLSKRQVINAIKTGRLRAIRLGSGRGAAPYMTTRREVEKWIDQNFEMNT
tara:strand:- start:1248 stop:1481 length:234 start_codon:yes stop_codon:yes gene_type:complete